MTSIIHNIPKIKHLNSQNFFLIAGPCVIEGEDIALQIAEKILSITDKLQIPLIFKGSYRKANRSRLDSFTGIGDEKALKILAKLGRSLMFRLLPISTKVLKLLLLQNMWMYCKYRLSYAAKLICWLPLLKPVKASM